MFESKEVPILNALYNVSESFTTIIIIIITSTFHLFVILFLVTITLGKYIANTIFRMTFSFFPHSLSWEYTFMPVFPPLLPKDEKSTTNSMLGIWIGETAIPCTPNEAKGKSRGKTNCIK